MTKKRKVYNVYDLWRDHRDFLDSLHLESVEKQSQYSSRKRIGNYLRKIVFIFIASFLTTLTFQFFINPNKLFNSGINGIIQVVSNYLANKYRISESVKTISYYGAVVIMNAALVFWAQIWYGANLEVNSTAIVYVICQFIWSNIFRRYSLQNYIFNRFSAKSWSFLSSMNQLGLTLPFYIVIGIVSSVIHTYGYSLIYWTKATPGGLEIITSALEQDQKVQKNKKKSIVFSGKFLGVIVILVITVFNFIMVEDNTALRKNELIDILNGTVVLKHEDPKIDTPAQLEKYLQAWRREKISNVKYFDILRILESWSGDHHIEMAPDSIFTYFEQRQVTVDRFERFRVEQEQLLNEEFDEQEKEKLRKKIRYTVEKIDELKLNIYSGTPLGYLKYITNDEKLWASLVYIFFSSYLINQIFPKKKLVLVSAKLSDSNELSRMLDLLKNYEPTYSRIFSWQNNLEAENYILNCRMTKWEYQLLLNEINKIGKISVTPVDETN